MTLATHDHAHDHSHGAHAGHDHAPGHGHEHGHAHEHRHEPVNRRADPGVSLLRMSSMQRLSIALGLAAAIWLGVFWAWS